MWTCPLEADRENWPEPHGEAGKLVCTLPVSFLTYEFSFKLTKIQNNNKKAGQTEGEGMKEERFYASCPFRKREETLW